MGLIFTSPNFASHSTRRAFERTDVWSRRMLVIQALNSLSLRRSGSTFRRLQQRSGSVVHSAAP